MCLPVAVQSFFLLLVCILHWSLVTGVRTRTCRLQLVRLLKGECSEAGQWQEREPYSGPQATVRVLAVHMLSCGHTPSAQVYALQRKELTGVRLVVCKCTGGKAIPEYLHGCGSQPAGEGRCPARNLVLGSLRSLSWLLVQFLDSIRTGVRVAEGVGRDSGSWQILVGQNLVKSSGGGWHLW